MERTRPLPGISSKDKSRLSQAKHLFLPLIKYLLIAISLIQWTGCATTGLPDKHELIGINAGKKAIVLLRITCEIDAEAWEPFQSSTIDENITFAIGGFDTGGKILPLEFQQFLSSETRKQGWTYFLLEPGIYYLGLQSPRSPSWIPLEKFKIVPNWRFDIQDGVPSFYIGTLHLTGKGKKTYWVGLNFKKIGIRSIESYEVDIRNEYEMAEKIIKEVFPGFAPPQLSIIQKQEGDTIHLRTPN
jgi:hypothetical protein